MSEWTRSDLEEIAALRFGKTPPRSEARFWNPSEGFPWATIADMRTDPVLETAETVSEAGLPFAGRSVSAGSVMMSFKLTVGRVARAGRTELLTNEAIVSVHGLEGKADDGWLYHSLPGIARGGVTDTAVKGATLNKAKLEKLKVHLPPLEEQRRIAEILDTIDETIHATERVITKRRRILEGLQTSLLKAHDGANWVTVGDLVSHHWPGEWGDQAPSDGFQEVTVLRATNLNDYGVDYSTGARRFVTWSKIADKRLMDGDLIVEAAGGGPGVPVGRVRRFRQPTGDTPCLTSNFFRTLRPKAGVDPDYLFWLLDNEYRKPAIWSCQQQTTGIINLKVRDYLERPVSYHYGSQVAIAQALDGALGAVVAERQQLQKLRETRAGLAADLLSGRVRTVAA